MYLSSQHLSAPVQDCIDDCTDCRNTCKEVLFQHCFEIGGRHVEKKHVNLMVDCIEICQMTANLLLRGSESAPKLREICADICERCAASCDDLRDEEMLRCAETCRNCADMCREMEGMPVGGEGAKGANVTLDLLNPLA
jgi:hypothetical protein